MDRPLCLIVNPAAGRGRSRQILPHVRAELNQAGADYQVLQSRSLEHAGDLAEQAAKRGEAVIAVGGDGMVGALAGMTATLRRAGAATADPGAGHLPVFGVIPAGRGNDFARVLGIPSDPAAAARALVAGHAREIDLIGVSIPGLPEEAIVAGSIYAGLPAVAGEIANASRWLPGVMVYNVAALRALARWRPLRFEVRIGDGAEQHDFDGYAVIVANNCYFGAGMLVAPQAVIDDGLVDVVLLRQAAKVTFIRALIKVKDGSHVKLPQVTMDSGASVTLTMSRDMPAGADGEPLPFARPLPAGTPLTIRALPAALSVLAPAVSQPAVR